MSHITKKTSEGTIMERYNPYNPTEVLSEVLISPLPQKSGELKRQGELTDKVYFLEQELEKTKQAEEIWANILYSRIKQYFCNEKCKDEYCFKNQFGEDNLDVGQKFEIVRYCLDKQYKDK